MKQGTASAFLSSVVGALCFAVLGAYGQAYRPPIEAKPGYAATGAVVQQDVRTLILNTTPCDDQEKQIVIFRTPFGTKSANPIVCPSGKTLQQVTANQG